MNKRIIEPTAYAEQITKELERGVYVTTASGEKVNSMVIGWGHIGRIWERPVFVTYVRDCRYTWELLEKNPEFTVNVPMGTFDKNAFAICGTKSGRDMDKIAEAGLTVVPPEVISVPGIKEFPLTLECRVIYKQKMDASILSEEIRDRFYVAEPSEHTAYYGEIVASYIIEE